MICCVCGKEIVINHGSVEMSGAYCDKCIKFVTSAGVVVSGRHITTSEPTRKCLVCGRLENPDANAVKASAAWLCDRCRLALATLVDLEDKIKENIT